MSDVWDQFVATAGLDAARLADAAASGNVAALAGLGQVAFRIGLSSALLGADDVGRLAVAIEHAIDGLAGAPRVPDALAAAVAALRDAMVQLAHADKSGARVEGLALDDHRRALDAGPTTATATTAAPYLVPTITAPPVAPPAAEAATIDVVVHPAANFAWTPTVDDDMIDLFFDEADDRVAALAGKLVELERRPHDAELIAGVFRDLHTVKGSSAMVGLVPVNHLAHAAEDLVGQVRDAGRAVDASVIDALLAALDALRDMLAQARVRQPITLDPAPTVARLRNPGAPAAPHVELPPVVVGDSAAAAARTAEAARQTIRVDFDKLDRLLNLVGELVLGRDGLRGAVQSLGSITAELATDRGVARRAVRAFHGHHDLRARHGRGIDSLGDDLARVERVLAEVTNDLDQGTDRLDAISGELRDQVMRLRMVSVSGILRKHVRTVRDLAATLGKRARLELEGEDTELDKLLVEALDEPLLHLVRNAVDHGLEPADARVAAGKPAEGVVRIAAAHRGNQVELRVSDDGRGLDPGKLRARAVERGLITAAEAAALDDAGARELIFRAGFSTAATVSEVSGRGVGMDIVRQTIVARLKGTIEVESTPGHGSAFVLKLPLTLAIIQVIVARAGGETFAIPLDVVKRVLSVEAAAIERIGDREVCVVRGHHVPLIRLDAVLELDGSSDGALQLVLVEHAGQAYALACDHLVGKREIVIKSLGPLLAHVPCTAGATLLGDRVALILDVPAIVRRALDRPAPVRREHARTSAHAGQTHILLVEDSDTVRESLRRLLADAGYVVTVAVDGQHGLELAQSRHFDLVSTDVMMPRLDGYELTRALRALPAYANTPIVMVTSMGERIDRVRGFDAGVDEYITKPHDRSLLLRAVRKLLGHAAPASDDPGAEA